ncbi:putative bifunctional diguanylate cyclase/phosphodiesterase [Chromobacterium aquaticum]|uniref:Bifunctional diguanylate cyclase/phosphodiesterase n=1 Tax=Chromobacterium aquaticum TaxID=467180 RepID=A0ABV8ZUH9_9NEIS|nr:EAL domain-containing protein [Chromobacterium aquaticum]MCD5361428.1 EAL domain-containing protein [Chromobacterium aquaticum]
MIDDVECLLETLPQVSVLVVDDDDVDRERIIRLLHRNAQCSQILEADSKASALRLLGRELFDFVFLDFKLDDGDGRELVPSIQQRNQSCLIVAVTGTGNERIAAEAIKLGVYEYLPKFELTEDRLRQTISDGVRVAAIQAKLRETEQLLQHRSLYDSLTDLPNRNLFLDRLDQLCALHARNQLPFAVLMIDLDRFKEVNDKLGHQAGDLVLREVGVRFSSLLRGSDTIARLGGDEFAALLLEVDSAECALSLAEKVGHTLDTPILVGEHALSIGASFGVAMCPQHGRDPAQLLSCADIAMYQAKSRLGAVALYAGENDKPWPKAGQTTQALITQLTRAIQYEELEMHYQPKVRLDSKEVLGFEALVRWNKPLQGQVNPDEFMPTLESCNLLSRFTYLTLELVLSQQQRWIGQPRKPFKVAVNISARMLEDEGFVEQVVVRLADYQVPSSLLVLELTETALVINPVKAKKVIEQLHAHGVSLSIDDFGAGFTSFTYLKSCPITEIKLDKAFAQELEPGSFNAALIQCMAVFCQTRAIDFIVEGVERKKHWPLLMQLGCYLGQGYSIAKPMPATKVLPWLEAWEPNGPQA